MTLAFCWSHQRRDFIECAAGQVSLTQWCQGWVEQIAVLYRLNEARLEHYDPGLERQTPAFDAAQGRLKEALDGLFAEAEQELAGLPDQAREGKALRSLVNHREGLCVFVDRPQVPLDNNLAERVLRGPVIGRRLSFGSDSENGARFTAAMYSVVLPGFVFGRPMVLAVRPGASGPSAPPGPPKSRRWRCPSDKARAEVPRPTRPKAAGSMT